MAIFKHQQKWIASHMPLANSIHSHQILFVFEFEDLTTQQRQRLQQISDNDLLISMLPERFDLSHLMANKISKLKVALYSGHFERKGKLEIPSAIIKVKKLLLNQMLTETSNGYFYVIPFTDRSGLLVHRIGKSPSFDQVVGFQVKTRAIKPLPKLVNFNHQVPLTLSTTEHQSLGLTKLYYLETQDFQ